MCLIRESGTSLYMFDSASLFAENPRPLFGAML
jgi:hypothetical protein